LVIVGVSIITQIEEVYCMIPFLGNRIQNAREIRGFRAIDIAKEVGVGKSVWSLYESENRIPSLATLIRIAEALNVSTDYLLGLTDEFKNLKE
jgi:transcriptional regulator with XRE-family HTH domain